MQDIINTKKQLRNKHLAMRNALSVDEIMTKSYDIMESVVSSYDFQNSRYILVYAAYGSEVVTKGIIEYALWLKKRVFCPKVLSNEDMEFYEVFSYQDLKPGFRGILEPLQKEETTFHLKDDPALILIPGVCFDEKGHRIGYGKGYYDRYLSRTPGMIRMALAFEDQIEESIPHQEQDVCYDLLVTELRTVCLLQDDIT